MVMRGRFVITVARSSFFSQVALVCEMLRLVLWVHQQYPEPAAVSNDV
jgi:hypothetical protein